MTRSSEMTSLRRERAWRGYARLVVSAALALLVLTLTLAPVAAADPSPAASGAPSAASTSGPGGSAAPAANTDPCPPPTPAPSLAEGATPTPSPTLAPGQSAAPTPAPNLCPAQPHGADPISLLAWIFTPIFQVIFMALAFLYDLTGDIGVAIILVTILIRLLLVPVFRAQIVSQRRMQMLQPELRAISTKYKGNRTKISEEQMKLYKERGYNPAAGCLPAILQMVLLLPMYQVFREGLTAPDISSMLQVFGHPLINVACQDPGNPLKSCIDSVIPWLFNTNAGEPQVIFSVFGFGVSVLAVVSSLLQLVQTRMMQIPSDDPQQRSQQRIFLILPLFSLIYGGILPAGLFIYWITTTVFSIAQQFLIAGWGGMFPLFGWHPEFAKNHQPRFPVPPLKPHPVTQQASAGAPPVRRSAADSAAGTIRPARTRARTSRRGRRR
jgi:YidC/Oxa1 family membrane protein insertase